jgi:hypothetical protein
MSKAKGTAAVPISHEDLASAVFAIAQAVQAQAESTAQIMKVMQQFAQATQPPQPGAAGGAAAQQISIFEDDPFSEESATANPPLASTIGIALPVNNNALLQTRISEPAVAPGQYNPGTSDFRFWVASEALARGINFWAPLLPTRTRWKTFAVPMRVGLNAGQDLNAFYSRTAGLRFFQQVVRTLLIASAESPDVVCHELGHAILDAIRPQLFDAASLEAAAFHEAFGDMSAILCALQLPRLRQKVLDETQGRLNVNSRLSRLAEQLGWAIRQLSPSAVDRDCLRNAANRFFYQDPRRLPPSAPAIQLSSEAHSFARVFTGAFLDVLARMLTTSGTATEPRLLQVSQDMGRLLVNGILAAPILPRYYSQVAAGMLQADRALFQGRYQSALSSGFLQHGILAPSAAVSLAEAEPPAMAAAVTARGPLISPADDGYEKTAAEAPTLPTRTISSPLGIAMQVHAPAEVSRAAAAAAAPAGDGDRTPDEDAAAFVENLMMLGRIAMDRTTGAVAPAGMVAPAGVVAEESNSRRTHTLVQEDGKLTLKRLHFDCGFHGCGD